jgi:hypothetical protein
MTDSIETKTGTSKSPSHYAYNVKKVEGFGGGEGSTRSEPDWPSLRPRRR